MRRGTRQSEESTEPAARATAAAQSCRRRAEAALRFPPVRRAQGFGSVPHLAIRFFGSLVPVGPKAESERWARAELSEEELRLFGRMSAADRRHAIGVARRAIALAAERRLGGGSLPEGFTAAALLHDVGKIESRLGSFSRVYATLAAIVLGRRRVVAWYEPEGGPTPRSFAARTSAYVQHDRIGAALLEQAGSSRLVSAWAGDHHLPEERWSVDREVGRLLKLADGD